MAQDYVVLKEKNENGVIAINKNVFKSISEISIDDIENAIRIPSARFTKPLAVKIENNQLHITADIKVKYGSNVSATCELVQNRIYENIVFMTGFKPADVTVNVIDFEI
ncbi:MAG: Asp23/Gls24 family envelope stress response protein [Erysipelotrichaceae bacterium]|nr:Asp23/Gls24 family envelope stress response protein [Erysipelotrichaceae bacterium]MDY6035163.1 Asp23/Gls24 family envelope stress response protein [Bulleidia sp.]